MKTDNQRIKVGEFTTIYKRGKKGTYTADFHCDGQHARRSLKTSNLKIARQRAVELERQINAGELTTRGANGRRRPETIAQAIEEYINYLETEGRRPKTLQKYRGILTNFASFSGLRKVSQVSSVDMRLIDHFRAHRKALIGPKSMHHEGVTLKAFLEWCRQR